MAANPILIAGGLAFAGWVLYAISREGVSIEEEDEAAEELLDDELQVEELLDEELLTAEEALALVEAEEALAEAQRQQIALEEQNEREEKERQAREDYEREQDELRRQQEADALVAEELLQKQREEDARYAEVERQRREEEKQLEDERQEAARRLQELFWKQEEAERQRLLDEDLARIAEEKARIPVIIPNGSLRVTPNIAIATGGREDIMDVTWGYTYVSGPPHLFIVMKVIYRGGSKVDQQPVVGAASPGTSRTNWRHRFGAGHHSPGTTHSVTVQVVSTPTDRNEWTVAFEETVTFSIPAPPQYGKSRGQLATELGQAVYRGGMSYSAYDNAWRNWFRGLQQRVEGSWIKRRYDQAKQGQWET